MPLAHAADADGAGVSSDNFTGAALDSGVLETVPDLPFAALPRGESPGKRAGPILAAVLGGAPRASDPVS